MILTAAPYRSSTNHSRTRFSADRRAKASESTGPSISLYLYRRNYTSAGTTFYRAQGRRVSVGTDSQPNRSLVHEREDERTQKNNAQVHERARVHR